MGDKYEFPNPNNPVAKLWQLENFRLAIPYLCIARDAIGYGGSRLLSGNWHFNDLQRDLSEVIETVQKQIETMEGELEDELKKRRDYQEGNQGGQGGVQQSRSVH